MFAALLGIWALPGQAAQTNGSFPVSINLLSGGGPSNTALCRSSSGIGAFGTALTIVCSNGTVVNYPGDPSNLPWINTQDSSYDYFLTVYSAGQPIGTVDSYTGVGTVTTWRMINLGHQDYLEMMVHW